MENRGWRGQRGRRRERERVAGEGGKWWRIEGRG